MPLTVNLRRLEAHEIRLQGELSPDESDLDPRDEMIRVASPVQYDLEIENLDDAILGQGELCVEL